VDLNAGGVARGNLIQLTQGDSGVYAGTRSIVKDNIVRSGSATYSIRAAPGSTSVLIKDNEVTAPVSNGGDSTNVVTGTTVIA
jgi:precorrin-3B methylase